jgi:hypothetical protein
VYSSSETDMVSSMWMCKYASGVENVCVDDPFYIMSLSISRDFKLLCFYLSDVIPGLLLYSVVYSIDLGSPCHDKVCVRYDSNNIYYIMVRCLVFLCSRYRRTCTKYAPEKTR